jgi:hypothetical protein
VEKDKKMAETLSKDFLSLTEENRKNIVDMTKFLVLAQNTIVPKILDNGDKNTVDKIENI